jgi:CheY-like chemotaxis protein
MSDRFNSDRAGPRSEPAPSSAKASRPASVRFSAPPSARTRKRIVVVDDSAICLEATAMMLEEAGYEVVTVDSPFALSSTMTREAPDLVLVDIGMPGLAGDKLVEITLRNQERGRLCAIVLHSDRPEHDLLGLARACGASGYIRKTSDGRTLAREIERILAR